ncbi:hypothetical protein PRUPE_1G156100 [Prunus persica]|uniref:Uncharacterized protein n=1 Tax=Prunus persica TaxID=3760 RepID=A0A251QY65_PRUPE|nr:hypothetical protein PRUPE_1G156100 [Prunus persica]
MKAEKKVERKTFCYHTKVDAHTLITSQGGLSDFKFNTVFFILFDAFFILNLLYMGLCALRSTVH